MREKHVDPDLLLELYVNQRMTTYQIAAKLGLAQRTVYLKVKKLGVMRTNGESRKGKTKHTLGDRMKTSDGYWRIYFPDHPNATAGGYVLEHRLVMSNLIGRPLLPTEVVHHKNENRLDNRPENLELYASPGIHTSTEHRPAKTDQQMLFELLILYRELGRPLKHKDLKPYNGVSCGETYRVHFGSWREACKLINIPTYNQRHA